VSRAAAAATAATGFTFVASSRASSTSRYGSNTSSQRHCSALACPAVASCLVWTRIHSLTWSKAEGQ
jgi:hypothetical protein